MPGDIDHLRRATFGKQPLHRVDAVLETSARAKIDVHEADVDDVAFIQVFGKLVGAREAHDVRVDILAKPLHALRDELGLIGLIFDDGNAVHRWNDPRD